MPVILTPHPGEEIKRMLRLLNVNHNRLANDIGESSVLIDRLIRRKTQLTPNLAIKIAKAISTTPEALMEMQARHDISRARRHENAESVPIYPLPKSEDDRSE
ncbi:HigA family addiction module antidote protein [Pantoea sp. Al-1710]|uniref:HigA family addiction module antidote protein n=1 Tax=Candidatus Pantoea communis TaxID=2608354 RepID=A0ABX0RIY9_9GAMM|nr:MULTISPECIES: HigA family addiction module antitoxin [Pantoea]NIG12992.1 HigA family addiction module antidote protein [Pantoea sp. Cy-640]NIG17307.1 HigA family addiction module antidote protein [Pantoea communis]